MAKRYLLDTHVVIDLGTTAGYASLPAKVRRILEDPEVELLLSAASEAEVAIKNRMGKLALNKSQLQLICSNAKIVSYPLRRCHVDCLFELPLHHQDPFDRLIISTALSDDVTLLSRDRYFRKYQGLQVVW